MALASPRGLRVEGNSQSGCHRGELQLLLTLGDSLRSARGSDLGSFQVTASAPGPGVLRFCVPVLRTVSLSYNPLALLKISPLAFKARRSGGSSSQCGTPGL